MSINKHFVIHRLFIGWGSLILSLHAHALTFSEKPLNVASFLPPNVLFSLSVEYPTGNTPAYKDRTYFNPTIAYDGYFDPSKCYDYIKNSATDTSDRTTLNSSHFTPSGFTTSSAQNFRCDTTGHRSWSGSFLNWLTASALDIFRKYLTGGTRAIDIDGRTRLSRAWYDGQVHGAVIMPDTLLEDQWVLYYTPLPAPSGHYLVVQSQPTNYAPNNELSRTGTTPERYGNRFRVIDTGLPAATYTTDVWNDPITPFKLEVEVCNPSFGLESNCLKYGNQYKPVGFMQQNPSFLFSAFSYTPAFKDLVSRAGGLMRSPLKGLNGKPSGLNNSSPGTSIEIDPATGILVYDPEALGIGPRLNIAAPLDELRYSSKQNSGIINYINQFGHVLLPPNFMWTYNDVDNIGELYYESLRYLSLPYGGNTQSVTPEYAMDLLTGVPWDASTANDGFPWSTTYQDPILNKCQSNYNIILGDVNTHCDGRIPGGITTGCAGDHATMVNISNPIPSLNTSDWIAKISSNESLGDLFAENNLMNCPGGARGCWGGGHNANLPGLAYWANAGDIRPDIAGTQSVKTFVMDVQELRGRIQKGAAPFDFGRDPTQFWLTAKYGGYDVEKAGSSPDHDASSWNTNGDGIPDYFMRADSPDSIKKSLDKIFKTIKSNDRIYKGNGHLALNTPINPTDTTIYQTYYANISYGQWEGNVISSQPSYSSNNGQVSYALGSAPNFTSGAAQWLLDATVDGQPRQIITATRSVSKGSLTGVPFQWGSIGTYTQGLLTDASELPAIGEKRLRYIRGDRSNEQDVTNIQGFRTRPATVLGDIINSSPVFVGPALTGFSDSDFSSSAESYASFSQRVFTRRAMVYVGANDGMLHAFDAVTLKEVFSFIPNSVLNHFLSFTSLNYNHNYYVDETPLVADVELPGRGWSTVLIGFPGMGGKGLFALDVSSPDNAAPNINLSHAESHARNIFLWELNGQVDDDIGYILNRGQINHSRGNNATMQVGRMSNGRWAVVTGNGYNSVRNSTGLVVTYLDNTNGNADYQKVMVPGAQGGLSAPTIVDSDYDGKIDYAYAGDLQGNIWRFNLRGNPQTWSAFKLFSFPTEWAVSPITTAPAVNISCHGQGLMVLVGTGQYLQEADNAERGSYNGNDAIIAINDNFSQVTLSFSDLTEQWYYSGTYTNSIANSPYANVYISSNNSVDWDGGKRGWYLPLYDGNIHMRIVTPPYIVGDMIYFNTIAPYFPDCGDGKMQSSIQAVNTCSGSRPEHAIFDINYKGIVNDHNNNYTSWTTFPVTGINIDDQQQIYDSSVWIHPNALKCATPPCDAIKTALSGVIGVTVNNLPPYRLSWTELSGLY